MKPLSQIVFAPLEAPLDPSELRQARKKVLGIQPLIIVAILLFVMVGMAVVELATSDTFHFFTYLFITLIGSFVGFFGYQMALRVETDTLHLKRFVEANGLTLYREVIDPGYAGMLFNVGRDRKILYALELPVSEEQQAEFGRYQYVIKQGKNSGAVDVGYIRLKLSRRLPHMLLDAKKNNVLGEYLSNLPAVFDKSQTLSLEGDFDKYFTLYAPQQYERDALYVFTPDVMAALLDSASAFDIEIVEDELYLYSTFPFDLTDVSALKQLIDLAATIQPELEHQTDYYSDERVGNRLANVISPQGKRLKRGIHWGILLGVLVYFLGFAFSNVWLFTGKSPVLIIGIQFLVMLLTTFGIGWAIVSWYRKNKPQS